MQLSGPGAQSLDFARWLCSGLQAVYALGVTLWQPLLWGPSGAKGVLLAH